MSSEIWKLEKDLCRCCLNEGSFKNLSESGDHSSQTELYVDMLKDCFNLEITQVPGILYAVTFTICEACIIRLQDATEFKKQVQTCEARFRDMYSRNVIKVADAAYNIDIDVKEEPDQEDDLHEECSHGDNDSDYNELVEYKLSQEDQESDKEVAKKKRKKYKTKKSAKSKTSSVKVKKVKQETEEDSEGQKKGRTVASKYCVKKDEDYTKDGGTFQCTRCDKTFSQIYVMKEHVKVKHFNIARYSCNICMKEFMTPAPFMAHKLEEHNVDDRLKCNACEATFLTKEHLVKHRNNFHKLGRRYKCELCDYETFSVDNFYKHKFKHKTVKDYHCRFCQKSFARKKTLNLHERIHTGDRRHVCNVCGQSFVQKASLNYHMTKYHPEVNF